MITDPTHELTYVQLLAPAAKTANFTTTAVDISAFVGDIAVVLTSAAPTGTTPTLAVKAQSGAASDGADAADLTGSAFAGVTTAASLQVINVDKRACGKYLTIAGTVGGTTPSYNLALVLVGRKQTQS